MTTLDTLRQNRAQAAIDAKWYEREAITNVEHRSVLLDIAAREIQQHERIDELIKLIENEQPQ